MGRCRACGRELDDNECATPLRAKCKACDAVKTPSGKPGLRLGLDRKDTAAPYRSGNVVVCCLVCNRLKSSTFTHAEMLELGRCVMRIWRGRGLDAALVD